MSFVIYEEDVVKKINSRGSHNVEYAIVLACIVSVGVTFFSGDTLKNILAQTTNGIMSIITGNPGNILASGTKGLANVAFYGDADNKASQSLNGHVAIMGSNGKQGQDQLIQLESNQDYEVVIDLNALQAAGINDINRFGACLFLWNQNDSSPKANLDSADILFGSNQTNYYARPHNFAYENPYADSKVTVTRDMDNNTMTCAFTTKENAYFGMNLTYKKYGAEKATEQEMQTIADNYQKFVTLQKVTK